MDIRAHMEVSTSSGTGGIRLRGRMLSTGMSSSRRVSTPAEQAQQQTGFDQLLAEDRGTQAVHQQGEGLVRQGERADRRQLSLSVRNDKERRRTCYFRFA